VQRKTIQRDIDYLRYQLDAPIAYSAAQRGYYYTETRYRLPAISIRECDLFAIYIGRGLLEQYANTPLYGRLSSVFKKIEDALPDRTLLEAVPEQQRFTLFPAPHTRIDPDIWDTMFACVRSSKRVEIDYRPPGQRQFTRLVDPYHAVRFDGDWYITGYCHTRQDIRTFSLSRIIRAVEIQQRVTIPTDFNFQRIIASRFGVHWGGTRQHVQIHGRRAMPHSAELQQR